MCTCVCLRSFFYVRVFFLCYKKKMCKHVTPTSPNVSIHSHKNDFFVSGQNMLPHLTKTVSQRLQLAFVMVSSGNSIHALLNTPGMCLLTDHARCRPKPVDACLELGSKICFEPNLNGFEKVVTHRHHLLNHRHHLLKAICFAEQGCCCQD